MSLVLMLPPCLFAPLAPLRELPLRACLPPEEPLIRDIDLGRLHDAIHLLLDLEAPHRRHKLDQRFLVRNRPEFLDLENVESRRLPDRLADLAFLQREDG